MSTSIRLKGFAAIAASVALVIGSVGGASAQNVIPGDSNDGRTAIVNSDRAELRILDIDREAGIANMEFENLSDQTIRCEAPSQDSSNRGGVAISTSPVIAAATEYYERFQVREAGEIEIEESITIVGNLRIFVPFWPLLQLVPSGSATQFMSDRVQLQSVIVEGHRDALTQGLAASSAPFNVNAGQSFAWSVPLSPAASSQRGEDEVGAIVVCGHGGTQGTQQLYAWSAYESGDAPQPAPDGTGSLDGGSLGAGEAGDTGSLGSLGSSLPDNGDNGDGDDESED